MTLVPDEPTELTDEALRQIGAVAVESARLEWGLAGQADLGTLDQLSRHIGDDELVRPAPTWSSDGRRSLTEHATDVRLAPVEYLRQLPTGEAIVLYGNLPPIRLRALPYGDDPTGGAPGRDRPQQQRRRRDRRDSRAA